MLKPPMIFSRHVLGMSGARMDYKVLLLLPNDGLECDRIANLFAVLLKNDNYDYKLFFIL